MVQVTNADGLAVDYGRTTDYNPNQMGETLTAGAIKQLKITYDLVNGQGFPVDTNADGTGDAFHQGFAKIPAYSYIKAATIIPTVSAAGGTSINFGLSTLAGSAIDADGIDAAVATAAMAVGTAVKCDGALVNSALAIGSADAYVYLNGASGTFTAGKGVLLIEYIDVV